MTSKIAILHPERATASALLAEVANRDGLEAVVVVSKARGAWRADWSDMRTDSACMAVMKLHAEMTKWLNEDDGEDDPLEAS